jgi:hypothetical protein
MTPICHGPSSWSRIKCGIDSGEDPGRSKLFTQLLNSLNLDLLANYAIDLGRTGNALALLYSDD